MQSLTNSAYEVPVPNMEKLGFEFREKSILYSLLAKSTHKSSNARTSIKEIVLGGRFVRRNLSIDTLTQGLYPVVLKKN